MIKTRYPTENGKLTIVNSNMKIKNVVHRFWVSIQTRISLVELLNAISSMNTKTRNATGRRNLRITFLLRSLNILKHKLILSLGEQFGLDSFAGDKLTIAEVGRHNSFALSIFSRFIFLSITLNSSNAVWRVSCFEIFLSSPFHWEWRNFTSHNTIVKLSTL